MSAAALIPLAIGGSIALLVFALGLEASRGDALHLLRRPGLLLRSVVSMNVVMLAFAVAVAAFLELDPAVEIAIVALALSPVPPILPRKQARAGGTPAYAIELLAAAAAAAVVLVPAGIELVGLLFRREAHMPISEVAPVVLTSVLAPLAAGILVRLAWPSLAARIARPASIVAAVLLAVAVVPVLWVARPQLAAMVGNGTLVVLALFTLIGVTVGHLLGGPDPEDRIDLALATGTRHPGVAFAIASYNAPDQEGLLAVVLWHLVVGGVVAVPYIAWRKRRQGAAAAAEAAGTDGPRSN